MKKKDNTKRILTAALLAYLALGIIVGMIFYDKGVFERKNSAIVYNFEQDTSNGLDIPNVSILAENELGDSHDAAETVSANEDTEAQEPVATEEAKKYYSFKVHTEVQKLMIRENPSLLAKIIAKMPKGTNGYVLEYGEDWCLVTDGTTKGYSYTEFLDLTELDPNNLPEDFPEEYR